MGQRWNVTASDRFTSQLREIAEGYDWSDVVNNLFWFLSRGPEQVGHGTQDLNVRVMYLAPGGGIPPIKVFYAIDPGEVTLLFVKEVDEFPF
ncbi:MAG TPA: hypothetical protein VFR37_07345 [Longimicrobium sp.]|nr:hypothetical protein [Longimicrobium sp.]